MAIYQTLIALDQFINTLFGGTADETLSARSFRLGTIRQNKIWYVFQIVIDKIFFWQPNHCKTSFINEYKRKGSAREYQNINELDIINS